MVEGITLYGADDVRSAGHRMVQAADTMKQAASAIDYSLERHQRFMDDWLMRFEIALEKLKEDRPHD